MQIVIDIPEEDYTHICEEPCTKLGLAVANGILLPKGHGRLIDADADSLKGRLKLIRECEYQIYGREAWGFAAKCETAIEDAPTVIEAEE